MDSNGNEELTADNHRPIVGRNMRMVNFGIDQELSALMSLGKENNFFHQYAVVGIISPSGRRVLRAIPKTNGGWRVITCEGEAEPIFDIASITKFLLTLCTMALFERASGENTVKGFNPDSYVWDYLPPLGNKLVRHLCDLQVKHLMMFLAKFNAKESMASLLSSGACTAEEFMDRLIFGGLEELPGTSWFYCNHPSVFLGRVLENIKKKPLHKIMKEELFDPLNMINTSFFPMENDAPSHDVRIVPVGELKGIVHDPSARVFHKEGKSVGSAGIFSTATDLLRCLAMILDKGLSKDNRRIITPEYIRNLGVNHASVGPGFGLGAGLWNVFRKGMSEEIVCSDNGFFKLGHTGCIISCLPDHHCGVVVLTDHLSVPGRTSIDRALYKWFGEIVSVSAKAAKKRWIQDRASILREVRDLHPVPVGV